MKKLLPALFVALLMVLPPDAEARRMGGGKSFGQQSGNVTQRSATGLMAGPDRPPMTLARRGLRRATSTAMPERVLMHEIMSAPASCTRPATSM